MKAILSPSWWLSVICSTLVTMAVIVLIKRVAAKANIPVVSEIVQEV